MSAEPIGVVGSTGTEIPHPSASEAESVRVARSAGMMSSAIAVSRLTGLVREVIMAREFGAGFAFDAFLLGFRIPNLTRDLFAEGALSSAFVPVFTRYLATKGKREAAELSNLVATAVVLVVGVLCIAGMIFSPELVRLMATSMPFTSARRKPWRSTFTEYEPGDNCANPNTPCSSVC